MVFKGKKETQLELLSERKDWIHVSDRKLFVSSSITYLVALYDEQSVNNIILF